MTINFKTPEIKELQPRLLVLGVGGAGGNAIDEMIEHNLQGVELRQSPTLRQQGGANGIYTNKKYDDNGKHYMTQITMKRF